MSQYLSNAELKQLGRLSNWRGLGSIAWTWGVIFACFALYSVWPSVWTFAIGWLVMSGRHLALAILMHEGAHFLLLRNKRWNDRVGSWLTAYPAMVNMLVYRAIHLQHHKATWTDADPDLGLATPFPVTRDSMWRKVVRDLTGRTGWERYKLIARLSAGLSPKGKGLEGMPLRTALGNFVARQAGFLITNAILCAGLAVFGRWEAFFLLWWLPAFTGYSLVLRIRSIAEHAVVTDRNDELLHTRTTLAPFWLRFFIAPHHVNYHLEHHLFMFVPHYNLPKAHALLRREGVLDKAEIAHSYFDVLRRASAA
jgi:fatty acid desaturase